MPCSLARDGGRGNVRPMRELLVLAIHLLVIFAKLLRPSGVRAVAAESVLLKHQLLISNRSRHRAPNLTSFDRFLIGLTTLFLSPHAFGVDIDKDIVRRVLAKHYPPGDCGTNGPSWLTLIGHVNDGLWSFDLFRANRSSCAVSG